jgi:hypothetical protein
MKKRKGKRKEENRIKKEEKRGESDLGVNIFIVFEFY